MPGLKLRFTLRSQEKIGTVKEVIMDLRDGIADRDPPVEENNIVLLEQVKDYDQSLNDSISKLGLLEL